VVVRADVDRLKPDRLVIHGANFGTTTAPTVLLAKVPLQVYEVVLGSAAAI
jgi:hypothetical protein